MIRTAFLFLPRRRPLDFIPYITTLRNHKCLCIMASYEVSHFCMSRIKRKCINEMGSMVRCQGKENKRVWSRMLHLFVGDFTEIQIEGRDFLTITPQNQKIKNCFAGGHFFLSAFIYRWFVSVHRDISCSVEVNGNFAAEYMKKHFTSISNNWCHQDFGRFYCSCKNLILCFIPGA